MYNSKLTQEILEARRKLVLMALGDQFEDAKWDTKSPDLSRPMMPAHKRQIVNLKSEKSARDKIIEDARSAAESPDPRRSSNG